MAKLIQRGDRGLDYSWSRPDPWQTAKDGFKFSARYIGPDPKSGKVITPGELRNLHAAGHAVPIVFEANASRPYSGRPGGLADGVLAHNYCKYVLKMPTSYPIMAAYDVDTTPGNIDIFEAYGRGFAEAIAPYPPGAYGDRDILERLGALGLSVFGWQANASWWSRLWSKLSRSEYVHIQQNAQKPDHTVDLNTCLLPFYGWDGSADEPVPPPPVPPTPPTPDPSPEDDDMPIIITNANDGKYGPALVSKWRYSWDDGSKRGLSPDEWWLAGEPRGTPLGDEVLEKIPDYVPPVTVIPPVVVPPVTVKDLTITADLGAGGKIVGVAKG